jgi:nitroreductase
MEVFDAVRTVLAVRQYQDKPVPAESIHRIVEAGRLTGSSMNGQPWHFIVVQNKETLRQMGELIRTGPYIAQAPLAIVVVLDRTQYALSDGSRAIQSMILTAWSEGIGSNWAGWIGMDQLKPLLRIPADKDVLAVLPFGYPVKAGGRGKKKRKPLSEVASLDVFGQEYQDKTNP